MNKYLILTTFILLIFNACSFKKVIKSGSKEKKEHQKAKTIQEKNKPLFDSSKLIKSPNKKPILQDARVLRYPDGSYYQGDIIKGKREGYGKTVWPDGSYYIGEYLNDKENGVGIYSYPNGEKVKGVFFNGKQIK